MNKTFLAIFVIFLSLSSFVFAGIEQDWDDIDRPFPDDKGLGGVAEGEWGRRQVETSDGTFHFKTIGVNSGEKMQAGAQRGGREAHINKVGDDVEARGEGENKLDRWLRAERAGRSRVSMRAR